MPPPTSARKDGVAVSALKICDVLPAGFCVSSQANVKVSEVKHCEDPLAVSVTRSPRKICGCGGAAVTVPSKCCANAMDGPFTAKPGSKHSTVMSCVTVAFAPPAPVATS